MWPVGLIRLLDNITYECKQAPIRNSAPIMRHGCLLFLNVFNFSYQVKRLESQLDKQRETAILQREAAAQAKKELAAAEKELSNLRIDLRIAQREAKTAEEEIKKLQVRYYSFGTNFKN